MTLSSSAVLAQAAAPAATDAQDDGEEAPAIVVSGIRQSLTNARETKRNAEVIVDSISAADIGALPDRSVSEALQRIPGVTLQRTNENRDPARLAAEGGGVFIRGLSWVRSEFNGRDIFSANNGRSLGFEDVSADLLAGVDVYKNPSADMIEGGVGGLVNLRTRKPLDTMKTVFAASGDYNYADLRKKGYWSGNALLSKAWDLNGTELGVLLSGSIGNIGNRTDSLQTGTYAGIRIADPVNGTQPTGTFAPIGNMRAGQTYYVPSGMGYRRIDWEQKRTSFDGSVQLRTVGGTLFTFEAFIAKASPRDMEHAAGAFGLPSTSATYQFDSRNVLLSGTNQNANMDFNTRFGSQDKITRDFSARVDWSPTDRITVTADVQRITSEANVLSMTAFTQFGVQPGFFNANRPDFIFDLNDSSPSMSVKENGAALSNPANYWWAAAMDHIEHNTAGSWAQRADLEYKFSEGSFFKSLRVGARATDKEAVTRQTGWNWGLLSQQFWGSGGGAPVYLNQTGSPANPGLPSQANLFTYDNFLRGKIAMPSGGWFASDALVSNGTANAYSYLRSTLTSGWGWTPLTEAAYDTAVPGADNVSAGTSIQRERTYAGYALLRFGTEESPVGAFDGNIGVRIVRTDNSAIGKLIVSPLQGASLTQCQTANPTNPTACQPLADAIAFTAGNSAQDYVYRNSYTDVLPTLNLRFALQNNMLLRFAAGQAMVRPSFQQMVPFNTLSFSFAPDGYTPAVAGARTGTGGNPYLKPTKSTQLDLSWEYYWGSSNSLSVAAFFKSVKDYIFAGVSTETYTRNGKTVSFDVTRNMNGDEGTIKGVELAYQQFYDFLPGALSGLGLQGNFTFVDSSGGRNTAVNTLDSNQRAGANDPTLPLEGLSKYSFNVAALYEKYGVSFRLAYNWRSRYLLTTSAANLNAPVWSNAFGQLDGSLIYSLTANVKIGVQATNLLNSRTKLDVGGSALATPYSWTDTDRRIAFLVRTRF
ncbi:TonB-dependent receptor [Novosphingobium piscinae]|uniref:TonB-dependent receptor n=1 Tax=Novosphingobium piscinae TaxID=1507448 RepID=A0A7X1G095_9SPHN|nr:TonB-dependent receptor [Novosphingobium piscinae]MBC2670119.1 TonB-dependent receptor [Novosphingobium piscinae]